jgi:c-di-GMP-related signal transduction protein
MRTMIQGVNMIRSILVLSFLLAFLATNSNAQKLTKADFRVGMLEVNAKFDMISISKDFGYPTKIDTFIGTHRTPSPETTYVYHFDSLIVDVERFGIRTIEFISQRLKTHRGVRIGDTVEKVRSSYGKHLKSSGLDVHQGYLTSKKTAHLASISAYPTDES